MIGMNEHPEEWAHRPEEQTVSDLGIAWTDEGERGVYVQTVPQRGLGHKATDIEARVLRRIDHLEAEVERLRARVVEMEEHERQTHERLSAVLGTDDSLEECALRLRLACETSKRR